MAEPKKNIDNNLNLCNNNEQMILVPQKELTNVMRFLHGLERKIQEVLDEAVKKQT